MLGTMWTMEVQLKRFQGTVVAARLKTILVRVADFCLCSKNSHVVTLRGNALIYWVEQISRHPNIDSVARLLIFLIIQICSENVSD